MHGFADTKTVQSREAKYIDFMQDFADTENFPGEIDRVLSGKLTSGCRGNGVYGGVAAHCPGSYAAFRFSAGRIARTVILRPILPGNISVSFTTLIRMDK